MRHPGRARRLIECLEKRENPSRKYFTTAYPLQFHPGFTVKCEEDIRNHDPSLERWIYLLNCQTSIRTSANISRLTPVRRLKSVSCSCLSVWHTYARDLLCSSLSQMVGKINMANQPEGVTFQIDWPLQLENFYALFLLSTYSRIPGGLPLI
jgi:hypothetical protein